MEFRDEELDLNFDTEMEATSSLPFPFPNQPAAPRYEPIRMEEEISKEDKWRWQVTETFFQHRGLATDHIASYNNFVERGIHEMFREAEPFEVVCPDEERGSKKKVLISFGGVELDQKPEVEMDDRTIGARNPQGGNGSKSSTLGGSDKAKGKGADGLDEGKVRWLTNEDEGGSSLGGGANHGDGAGGSGSGRGDGHPAGGKGKASRETNGVNAAEEDGEEQPGKGKGGRKGKGATKYKLNVVREENGRGNSGEEPPKVSQETWGIDDSPRKEDVEDDNAEEDAAGGASEGSGEEMEVEDVISSKAGKAGKANGWQEIDEDSPPTSPAEHGEGEANGNDGMGVGTSDADPKMPSFGKPRRREPNLSLLPVEARLRGITYSSPIYVNVTMEISTPEDNTPQRKSSKSPSSSASSSRKKADTRDERVLLGRIPVMVKSSLCHLDGSERSRETSKGDCCFDPGGYFIIKGSEKVIVAQEERNLQRLWVSYFQDVWMASCTSRRKGFTYYNYHRTFVKLGVPKKTGTSQGSPVVTISLPGVDPLPMGVLFTALGVASDREILEMISYNLDDAEILQTLCPSLLEAELVLAAAFKDWDANSFTTAITKRDKEVALFYIGSKIYGRNASSDELAAAEDVLNVRFLPHLASDKRTKALFLGYMVRNVVLCYLGRQKGTDRDDLKNKRLEFAGEIISHHFRKLMGQVVNTMKKRIQKHLTKRVELQGVEKYLDDKVVTRGLKVAFSSGNWKGHDIVKNSGVVFDLKRGNPLSTICQLRELRPYVAPTTRVGDEARHPTFSQWGRVCPIDTPDGESCGLVKNLALTGMVSCETPEGPVLKILAKAQMVDTGSVVDLSSLKEAIKIFVNGRWMGIVEKETADRIVQKLRNVRRRDPKKKKKPDFTQVEVVADATNQEVHISTDGGRVLRPLLIVKDQALVLNEEHVVDFTHTVQKNKRFQWLLHKGVVELLGIEEEERAMVALHGEDIWRAKEMEEGGRSAPQFTHVELHPSLILGLSASVIPFPNKNQSSRNLFQAHKHSKQAIGFYVTNSNSRADTSGQHLFYPQKQLVRTNTFECLQKEEMFSGQNAIVAIACYTGYNQEDSIIMDQSSLDRGMFRTTHYRTVRAQEKSDHETFGKPMVEETSGPRLVRAVEKLDEDGLPGVGLSLGVGDVIVGKISKTQNSSDDSINNARMSDPSQRLKAHEKGCVEQVVLVEDEDGLKVAKVKLRETRMPQVGDKFSSMHGQKGIVGMVFTQEDLPFTSEGIVPDIIINPHAFPSRQTLGQMCESALGKVAAKTGDRLFATPFNPSSTVESISDALHNAGYERWGTETMYNGFTGQAMEANIFIGSTFYQRLTHMVEDKIKYRSRGHVHPLTRQPVSDRKRHGGVKFGEMERDCLIAHGAAATLQERSFILSDFHSVHVCTLCDQLANWNSNRVPECPHCKVKNGSSAIVKVELPYACKLLMQELMSMGISVRLKTERL